MSSPARSVHQSATSGRWREKNAGLLLLLLAALVVRGGVLIARYDQLARDPDGYRLIAENLRSQGVYSRCEDREADEALVPTAFRPPLYPLLLSAVATDPGVTSGAVAAVHLLLGIMTVFLTWKVANLWALKRGSYVVAVLVACDPILLNQSSQVMTETLATLLAVASLGAVTLTHRTQSLKWSCLAGILLGAATLCRPAFLVWTALIVAGMLFMVFRNARGRAGIIQVGTLALGTFLVLAPWMLRNQIVMGKPIWATTHGGYTLLLGNNPYFYEHLQRKGGASVWDAEQLLPLLRKEEATSQQVIENARRRQEMRGEEVARVHPEVRADQRLYEAAVRFIREQPAMFVEASLVRLLRLWNPLPHRLDEREGPLRAFARYLVAAWYVAVYLLGLWGALRVGRTLFAAPWLWGLLLLLAMTGVHGIYWSNMRMRAPGMPVVYLLAAAGASRRKAGPPR